MKILVWIFLVFLFILTSGINKVNADKKAYKEHVFDQLREGIDKDPRFSRSEKYGMKDRLHEKMYGKDEGAIYIVIIIVVGIIIAIMLSMTKEEPSSNLKACLHISAGGTFRYNGEGPGAVRKCTVCGLSQECYNPNPSKPHYVQWK